VWTWRLEWIRESLRLCRELPLGLSCLISAPALTNCLPQPLLPLLVSDQLLLQLSTVVTPAVLSLQVSCSVLESSAVDELEWRREGSSGPHSGCHGRKHRNAAVQQHTQPHNSSSSGHGVVSLD
jgi:hypothetical protein